jgi:hypothetical protein
MAMVLVGCTVVFPCWLQKKVAIHSQVMSELIKISDWQV